VNKLFYRFTCLFLLLPVLAACSTAPPVVQTPLPPEQTTPVEVTPTPQPVSTITPEAQPPTQTAVPATPTDTPLPTGTLTASPTHSPTPTFTPTPEPLVRFAVIGDYGLAGQPAADVAALVKSWDPDFIITTGDNNYPDGAWETIDENIGQYYHEYIHPYVGSYGPGAEENRFFPTLGNHDYYTNNAQPYFDYFDLPGNQRYYDFVRGPVHFFALNSNYQDPDGVGSGRAQAAWLREQLSASTSPWKIVYFHHTPYSSGHHGPTEWMLWPFKEWGASAVLAGHDHTYERLIINDFPYFVNGVGGGARYNFRQPHPGSVMRFNSDWGAQLVTASRQTITFEFFTRAGELIDSFTLLAPTAQSQSSPQAHAFHKAGLGWAAQNLPILSILFHNKAISRIIQARR
jgi:hypothetical protein